jgi:hypothetical protein
MCRLTAAHGRIKGLRPACSNAPGESFGSGAISAKGDVAGRVDEIRERLMRTSIAMKIARSWLATALTEARYRSRNRNFR